LHHEDFERYFEYRKQGHKYIIESIYIEPIEKVDNREIYSNLIKQLILNKLAKEYKKGNRNILLSPTQLFEDLYMVNKNYSKYKNEHYELSNELNIDINYINDFYLSSYGKLKSSLTSALKSLDNKGIVVFKEEYIINLTHDKHSFNSVMNDKQIELYNALVGEYITENKTDKRKIVLTGKWKEYNDYIIDGLSQIYKHEINYIYKAYKVYFNDNVISELNGINEYMSINEIDIGMMLNRLIVDRYKLSYIDRYDNYIDRYIGLCEMDVVNMKRFQYNDMIIDIGKEYGNRLIDYTIDRVVNRK
jgi:hypothetical protein